MIIAKPIAAVLLALLMLSASTAEARTTLKNICRVKGQEENTLQGLGLVIGLKGTGDPGNYLPTIRSLAKAMELMGRPLGERGLAELKDTKNVALVMVTATVPAAGGRQGDKLDCTISSVGGAKSLVGGQLFITALRGPQPENPRVYAFAQGPVHLDDLKAPTTAKVHSGCRLEEDFFNAFTKDGRFTLVLEKNHADFQVAQEVAFSINSQLSSHNAAEGTDLARAINQMNIEVVIPRQYQDDPVNFISLVLGLPVLEPQTEARVVINERAGSIVIGGDVEIGAVVVTHKNVVIETAAEPVIGDRFVPVAPGQGTEPAKLKGLVEALNAVKVPTEDIIEIIKGLERNGKLHGALIVE